MCFFWTSSALGAGFALVNQGVAAMGQGNAFVAEANDASAIYYNPAGISQLKRPQFYLGTFLLHPDREFHGEGGDFSQTNHRWYHAMSAYLAVPVHNRVALGLGFFSPFGLGTVWPPDWAGRYITTYSRMKTYNLNPVVSVKILENLSVAAGFDVLWSKVQLKRKFQVLGGYLPDGESILAGDGTGYGYNLGLLYEPVSGVKLGVSFRSAIEVNHKGDLRRRLAPGLPTLPTVGGSAAITYPPSVTWGVCLSRFKPFTFEFDTTWTGWSSYDELVVNFSQPVNGSMKMVTPKNWHDAWAFRFGANCQVTKKMKLRAGYTYDLTPVPNDTFEPQLPDANRHIFSVGSELKVWKFTLSFAYNYIYLEPRNKNNTITFNGAPAPLQANGRYTTDVHCLGLGWYIQF